MKHIFRFIIILFVIDYMTMKKTITSADIPHNIIVVLSSLVLAYILYRRDFKKKAQKKSSKSKR